MTTTNYTAVSHLIATSATKHRLSPLVVAALIQTESNWRNVKNSAGYPAYGLMQVVSNERITGRPTPVQLLDPATNIEWGCRILAEARPERDGLAKALWRYSGGDAWAKSGGWPTYLAAYWRRFMDNVADVGRYVPLAHPFPVPDRDTGAGVHAGANAYHPMGDNHGEWLPTIYRWRGMGLTWCKLVVFADEALDLVPLLLQHGIMPVLRLYRERPYPGTLTPKQLDAVAAYVRAGARYFERGNEPNLMSVEWSTPPANDEEMLAVMVRDWCADARAITDRGGYVAVDAMAPGGEWRQGPAGGDDMTLLRRFLAGIRAQPGMTETLRLRGWLSVHNAFLNHPLNYPYDAVNQAEHKGAHLYLELDKGGHATGHSNCADKWLAVAGAFLDVFGFLVPVMTTEGGAWVGNHSDPRYASLTVATASIRNEMFLRAMADRPRWFAAAMPWLWANRIWANHNPGFERDAWIRWPGHGNCPADEPAELPILAALAATPIPPRATVVPVAPPGGSTAAPSAPTAPPPAPLPPPHDPLALARGARWHSEEAVREIERGDAAKARDRLLAHVIPPLYELEGEKAP